MEQAQYMAKEMARKFNNRKRFEKAVHEALKKIYGGRKQPWT